MRQTAEVTFSLTSGTSGSHINEPSTFFFYVPRSLGGSDLLAGVCEYVMHTPVTIATSNSTIVDARWKERKDKLSLINYIKRKVFNKTPSQENGVVHPYFFISLQFFTSLIN